MRYTTARLTVAPPASSSWLSRLVVTLISMLGQPVSSRSFACRSLTALFRCFSRMGASSAGRPPFIDSISSLRECVWMPVEVVKSSCCSMRFCAACMPQMMANMRGTPSSLTFASRSASPHTHLTVPAATAASRASMASTIRASASPALLASNAS